MAGHDDLKDVRRRGTEKDATGALSTTFRSAPVLSQALQASHHILPSQMSSLTWWPPGSHFPGLGDCGGRARGPLVSKTRWTIHLSPRKRAQLPNTLPPAKEISSSETWNLLRTLPDLRGLDVPGCRSVVQPVSVRGRWPPGGMCSAERKWLRPDIILFVFPVKKKDHFTYFLGIWQIFLISPVSCCLHVFPMVSLSERTEP